MELAIERRVQDALVKTREDAKKEYSPRLKVAEKEQTITLLQKQIEKLKRRAEQGCQQLQGEVQGLELEETLRVKFPYDSTSLVPKGKMEAMPYIKYVVHFTKSAGQFHGNPNEQRTVVWLAYKA